MVHGLCRALLRDPVEAEDAAQQAFLSAHRSLLNGVEPREPAAWLATIARNECWARTSARMREPLPTDAIDEIATTHDPVAEAIRRADLEALWLAIRALPRQQRDALLLREFGGLRYDELAVALAVSEPSIESLLFRARTRLRTQLKTAYAALSGATWLEALARLLAGGGAPAVATKAVALGLGAAAVTGGAVVAPTLLAPEHHAVSRTGQRRPSTPSPTTAAAPAAVSLPAARAASSAATRPVIAFTVTRSHDSRRQGGDAASSSHEDHVRTETGDTHGSDNAVSSTASTREGDHSTSGSGSETSGDSHEGSTTASTSGSTSGSGSDGERDQPTATATTTTTTTATTVPTVTDPALTVPTETVPLSGEGDG